MRGELEFMETHSFQGLQTRPSALGFCIFWKPEGVLGDAVGEITVCLSAEGPTTKDEFVCAYTERPPVDGVGVTSLCKDFWGHVGH